MAASLHGRGQEGCAFPQHDRGRSSCFLVYPFHHNTRTCSVFICFVFLKIIPKIANSEWKLCGEILSLVKISMVLCKLSKRRPVGQSWVKYLLKNKGMLSFRWHFICIPYNHVFMSFSRKLLC